MHMSMIILGITVIICPKFHECKYAEKTETSNQFKNDFGIFQNRIKRCNGPFGPYGINRRSPGFTNLDPPTLFLLSLISGAAGLTVGGPLPATIPVRTVPTEPDKPKVEKIEHALDENAEQQETQPQSSQSHESLPQQQAPPPKPAANSTGPKRATGHVTPGNRCADSRDCVANAECVEAVMIRQKYCVCLRNRLPKGGLCV